VTPLSFDDRGSTIPLIIGFFVVAMSFVAGSVAAGDAFLQQRDLQSICDAAAAAAASSADLSTARGTGDIGSAALRLANVQDAVDGYLGRDGSRDSIRVEATLSADAETVSLGCTRRSTIAFGSLFGKGDGVVHRVSSSARAQGLGKVVILGVSWGDTPVRV
jgi:hypothetical protein